MNKLQIGKGCRLSQGKGKGDTMTIAEAKRDLPNVLVTMPNGKTYTGRVSGRLNQFPTVTVPYDGKLHSKGHKPWVDFHTSWEQVARKATDRTAIVYC